MYELLTDKNFLGGLHAVYKGESDDWVSVEGYSIWQYISTFYP